MEENLKRREKSLHLFSTGKYTEPMAEIDSSLRCLSLRQSTGDQVHYNRGRETVDIQMRVRKESMIEQFSG